MSIEALGRLFDVAVGTAPVDAAAGAATGNRVSLENADGVTFLVALGAAASGTEDVTVDVQQHTAGTGGTSSDLDVVDHYYRKAEATLDGDETWTKVDQTAASEVTVAGASLATQQVLLAIEVEAAQLSDGNTHVSLNVSDPGTVARLVAVVAVLRDLKVQRAPANLAAPQ